MTKHGHDEFARSDRTAQEWLAAVPKAWVPRTGTSPTGSARQSAKDLGAPPWSGAGGWHPESMSAERP